eukprot:1326207-Amphidinium_carterae.1
MYSQEEVPQGATPAAEQHNSTTTTVNLPVQGQVTLTGTVQLQLPRELAQYVVASQSGLTTAMSKPSTTSASAAATMTSLFPPPQAVSAWTATPRTSSPGDSVQQSSSSTSQQQQQSWTQGGKRWYNLDVLGGACISVGGRPEQRRTVQNTSQHPDTREVSEKEEHKDQLTLPQYEQEDALFVHMTELQEDDCTEAWTVLNPTPS